MHIFFEILNIFEKIACFFLSCGRGLRLETVNPRHLQHQILTKYDKLFFFANAQFFCYNFFLKARSFYGNFNFSICNKYSSLTSKIEKRRLRKFGMIELKQI